MLDTTDIKTKHLCPTFRRNFIRELENTLIGQARRGKDVDYIDTILNLCEAHDLEPEAIASIIPNTIREKIEMEAISKKLLPKSSFIELPI